MILERFQPLERSIELLERWQRELKATSGFEDALDRSSIQLSGRVGDFRVEDLRLLAEYGHRAELQIARGSWGARVTVEPRGRFLITDTAGPADEAFPDDSMLDAALAARDEGRATDLLALTADLECRARLTLQNEALETGFHWIRTADAFLRLIREHGWLQVVSALLGSGSPQRVVVHDAASARLSTSSFLVHGPDVFPDEPDDPPPAPWREYAASWLQERSDLPPPVALQPQTAEGFDEVATQLRSLAHGLSWLWLASSAEITEAAVRIRFEGAPDLEFPLTPLIDPSRTADAVRLWEWAVASTDPARREAVQQAVALVVRDPETLERAAERVLRTAKYLLRLAQQGAVAEALAIRRSSRQAAIDVGRGAGEASRGASRSVVDRVLTQLIGGFGVLLANQANLINSGVTRWLLFGLLGLSLATAVIAFFVEFPSVSAGLKSFEDDLDEYSDMLIKDDIERIKAMSTLHSAKEQLGRARFVSGALLLLAALVLGAALMVI